MKKTLTGQMDNQVATVLYSTASAMKQHGTAFSLAYYLGAKLQSSLVLQALLILKVNFYIVRQEQAHNYNAANSS